MSVRPAYIILDPASKIINSQINHSKARSESWAGRSWRVVCQVRGTHMPAVPGSMVGKEEERWEVSRT